MRSIYKWEYTFFLRKYRLILPKRGLAVPVNPSTSIDTCLGTAAPPPPTFVNDDNLNLNMSNFNPKDADVLERMIKRKSSNKLAIQKADIERIKGVATGAFRQASVVSDESKKLRGSLLNANNNWFMDSGDMSPLSKCTDLERPHAAAQSTDDTNDMERWAIETARKLIEYDEKFGTLFTSIKGLLNQKVNAQLSVVLPYEPNPKIERKVRLTSALSSQAELNNATDDGVLLICYVDFTVAGNEKVSLCSGFCVQGGSSLNPEDSAGKGELLITCAHTVRICFTNVHSYLIPFLRVILHHPLKVWLLL